MRDLLVTAIVLGALPFVFRHVWIGVILWTWLSVMNPHKLAFGFANTAPFAAIVAGVTLISLFTSRDQVRLPKNGAVYVLIAFVLWMCITTVFAMFPSESLSQLNKIVKIQIMTLVALAVLHERKHIQIFVWINALSLGFYGVKGGLYTLQTGGGGRVWGPPGGFIEGNNEIGLAMLMVIPLLYYLYLTTLHKWIRRGLVAAMLLSAIAVLGTQSRGAFLAIVAMAFVLWVRSPANKIVSGIGILLLGGALFAFMPETWHSRMGTIQTYEEDGSAMGRINAWETAFNAANDRPLGVGFEMYNNAVFSVYAPHPDVERAADPRIARAMHSIYFQALGEHGWFGLFLFVSMWWLVWRDGNTIRKLARGDPEYEWVVLLAGMCQVALVGYAVGGAFLSLAYFDLPYNLLVTIVVTQRWLMTRLQERQAVESREIATSEMSAARRISMGGRRE